MFPEQIKRFIIDSNQNRGQVAIDLGARSNTQDFSLTQQFNATQPNRNQINMDAYNAYYSNADKKESESGNLTTEGAKTNIINNIMHINHSGANINITAAPNCQNNFIFNHTAPINLNFYKD